MDIVSNKRNPFAILLLEDVNEVMDVNLTFVVLWVATRVPISILKMSHVVDSNDSSLMEVPLDHLCAKDEVGGALNSFSLFQVSVGEHSFIAAHLG